jgi:hypothetical protein
MRGKSPAGQFRELPIEARGQIVASFADLLFNEMIIVEQPFCGRRRGLPFADRGSDGDIRLEKNRLVVPQPSGEGATR